MKSKIVTILWGACKFTVFLTLFYTAWVMFRLRNFYIGAIVIFILSFYLIFNKIDSLDRRVSILEANK